MNNLSQANPYLNQLISPQQTSEMLGISTGTLTVWRSTGRYDLPFIKVGRRVMYNLEDIRAFIKKRTVNHTV